MRVIILCIMLMLMLIPAVSRAGDEHVPHSTIAYIIVPVADIDKAMLALVAQTSMESLRRSTNGELAVLKFARYKPVADPMPVASVNDAALTKAQLEYNAKLAVYPWTHKTTPARLNKYKQYTHAEILLELQKPEWVGEEPKEPIAEKPKPQEIP